MLSLVGALTAWADDDGRFYTASTFVDPANGVKEGVDYVFKGVGFGNSSDTYLNVLAPGNNGSTEITSDCIYQFVAAGDVDACPLITSNKSRAACTCGCRAEIRKERTRPTIT